LLADADADADDDVQILPAVLSQCNTGGVRATMLLNRDGSLLATVGDDQSAEKAAAASVSAIMANVWTAMLKGGDAQVLLIDAEHGRLAVTKVTDKLLLCLHGDATAHFGMLKLKAEALAKYLEKPLGQILQ